MIRKHKFLSIFILLVFFCIFTNYEPYVPSYGGKILINNTSSYNLYIILQTAADTEKMLCIEKDEQIQITHTFSGDYRRNWANPVNYYTVILFYDFDSGIFLNSLTVNAGLFEEKTGSIDLNNAVFELTINDVITGGIL